MKNLITLAFIASSLIAHAQVPKKGKVVDDITQEPLPGVEVKIAGMCGRFVTNRDGEFTLPTSPTNVQISFSLIGYIEQRAWVNIEKPVLIALPVDVFFWSDVVIVIGKQKPIEIKTP